MNGEEWHTYTLNRDERDGGFTHAVVIARTEAAARRAVEQRRGSEPEGAWLGDDVRVHEHDADPEIMAAYKPGVISMQCGIGNISRLHAIERAAADLVKFGAMPTNMDDDTFAEVLGLSEGFQHAMAQSNFRAAAKHLNEIIGKSARFQALATALGASVLK